MVLTNALFKVMYIKITPPHSHLFTHIYICIYVYIFIYTHNLSAINIQYCQFHAFFGLLVFKKNTHHSSRHQVCDGNGNATGASNMDQPYGGSYPYVSWVPSLPVKNRHISTRWTGYHRFFNGLESLRYWPKIYG